MNELQIRISADIKQLQSALSRAKKTINDFETETEKGSERSNVGFRRKIGLIEQLENRAKRLRVALRQATSEDQVERYNKELNQTVSEMTRLNALGRQVGGSLNRQASGFSNVATQGVKANTVALEFNRVIQDAPFGLIGIGNNLQQLAGNFSNVRSQAGSTGKAIKASLASIISPVNLGLLAVSALTAGFTAYQMGAFDGIFATRDFKKELEDFKETLNAVDSARLDSLKNSDEEITTLNALRNVIEDEAASRESRNNAVDELQKKYPNYFANLTREQILAGEVASAYEDITRQLVARSEVESSVERIVDLNEQERLLLEQNKDNLEEINQVRQRIASLQEKADKQRQLALNAETKQERGLAQFRAQGAENTIRFLRSENRVVDNLLSIEEDRARLKGVVNDSLKESLKLNKEISNVELSRLSNENISGLEESQLEAVAKALRKEITKDQIKVSDQTSSVVKDLFLERIARYKEQLKLVNEQLSIYKDETDSGSSATKDFTAGFDDLIERTRLSNQTSAEAAEKLIDLYSDLAKEIDRARGAINFKPVDFEVDFDPSQFDKLSESQRKFYEDLSASRERIKEFQDEMKQLGGQLSNVFAESFERGIFEGENFFDSIAQGFKRLLAQLASQLAAAAFLNILAAVTTGGASTFFGAAAGANPFGGIFKANGGPVRAGQPYIVGEKRPELFVPSTSGRIIPRVPSSPSIAATTGSLSNQTIDVNVYGQIMNDKIVLSNARGKRENGRFYGINN